MAVITEEEKKLIADRLVACRGHRSQATVANQTGLAQSTIAMYETAERIPADKNKIILAKYYDKTVQEIFFDGIQHFG